MAQSGHAGRPQPAASGGKADVDQPLLIDLENATSLAETPQNSVCPLRGALLHPIIRLIGTNPASGLRYRVQYCGY
jgi:hypothetical protein